MRKSRGLLLLLAITLSGCATAQKSTSSTGSRSTTEIAGGRLPSTQSVDSNAALSLDQIQPPVQLPTSLISERPEPPKEAILLFAKARIALLDGQRTQAARALEQAVSLDPDSFELHKSLGNLYASASDARAVDEWERAADIEPNHLDLQIQLGRFATDANDARKGISHLRLALLTTDYRHDDPAAGEADFLLAQALQKQGYDRAALQMYERLMDRIHNARMAVRANPQLATLITHPDSLALHIAALYEKNKAYGSAIALLDAVASRQPGNFAIWSRLVRDTAAAGDADAALRNATDVVAHFHADRPSVGLLRDVGGDKSIGVLEQLRKVDPRDREMTYALIDVLRAYGRTPAAAQVLAEAATQWPRDLRVLRRRVDLLRSSGDMKSAARFLILSLAEHNDRDLELVPLWDSLTRPLMSRRLRSADVESISVPPSAAAAKLLFLSRLAQIEHRDKVERELLARAVNVRPIFAPAWREMLALTWGDESLSPKQKIETSKKLSDDSQGADYAGLAAELRGQAMLFRGEPQAAATEFAAAVKAGDRSAELYLNFAAALHGIEDDPGAESLLWKVIGDRPLQRESYTELYALYEKRNETDQAQRVLIVWAASDPDNADAPRLQAREAFEHRRFAEAERILLDLFDRRDDDPEILGALEQFYSETARLDALASRFEKRLAAEPGNFSLAIALAEVYEEEHQLSQAIRVIDGVRARASHDPDLLYALSGLYMRFGQAQSSEQVLSEVLKIDPSYAGANNDLGYVWADRGKNLGQAETLVRKALQAEPDNPSFLDSMGWVLYKRGKFEEAIGNLTRAALLADPVVLDHLGDSLYRLGDRARAAQNWRQAVQKITELHPEDRDDLKQLRKQLLGKQQQLDAGQPVEVSPVGEK